MNKIYNTGLIVGRFQMLHIGHYLMIKKALELCDTVVVFIGSSQESRTEKNPFDYMEREDMIRDCFKDEIFHNRLICRALPDIGVGNGEKWGNYVLTQFVMAFNRQPDLYISGCEKVRVNWFTDEMAPGMSELRISRGLVSCSASEARLMLKEDNRDAWMSIVPKELWDNYSNYKKVINNVIK